MAFFVAALLNAALLVQQASSAVPPRRVHSLANGVNLSWVLQEPERFPDDPTIIEKTLDLIARSGFRSVRLPVGSGIAVVGSAAADRSGPVSPERNARTMARLKILIDSIVRHGLAVTVDMHQDGEEFTKALHCDDEAACKEAEAQLVAFWTQAARELASTDPEWVFFELLNEPNMSAREWEHMSNQIITVVRREAPHHTILVGGTEWYSYRALLSMKPYSDDNLVYLVHFYDPMQFTHQGASWNAYFTSFKDVKFPTTIWKISATPPFYADVWDASRILNIFTQVADWGTRNHVPIVVNEFGAISNGDLNSRVCWTAAVRRAAERNGIGWAYWDLFHPEAFGLMQQPESELKLSPALMAALGLGPPEILAQAGCG